MGEFRKNFLLEDGRRAERVVREDDGCEGTKTTEIYEEPKIPMKLTQRVIEKKKPIVYEREIEHLDESGEVVEKTVESLEPKVNMQVVDRIVSAASIPVEEDEPKCAVTREELREDIKEAVVALAKTLHSRPHVEEEPQFSVAPKVSMQSVIEDRLAAKSGGMPSAANLILLAVISAQVAGLAWILFFM